MKHADLIRKSLNDAFTLDANTGRNGWAVRHCSEWRRSLIAAMLDGAAKYADRYRSRYEDGIGSDYLLGDHWAAILLGVRALLNGETGDLDCGTVDGLILAMLAAEGFDENGERIEEARS